ncbi:hypothetical protein A1O3_06520 [Capronia epimyces CBS 606.96]|uniref:3-hydroxyisobutyrate dehydrogenase n=1 Tax=Capronia epimyces CBS 606.96 TaxID=1182542 RepID=W9Y0D9_9EURO|nr:uncharacterized protein A1O3_06520 [Capronia epimyces CBS 606.96]EXJ82706.1 hypothetical protein A1O3_06520 [Capronia epimyces CBS 606.96]
MPSQTENEGQTGMPSATYGFIGIGRMGFPMALNLRAKMPAASTLIVCDVYKPRVEDFLVQSRSLGPVEVASSPKEVAERCDIIITSLSPGKPMEQVFTDPSGSILAAKVSDRSKLVIDTSTLDVQTWLKIAEQVVGSGFGDFIDCPVSGGMEFAKKGELSSMIGGSKELFDRIRPIVLSFSGNDRIYHCGPPGSGLAAKIINNYIATISYVALCEGMNTGVRYGLDPKVLTDVINAGSGMCWNSLHMCPIKGVQPTSSASRDFKGGPDGGPGFDLASESTDMTVDLMSQVKAKSVMADVMKDIWKRAASNPHCQGKEYRSLYRLFSEDDGAALENGGP